MNEKFVKKDEILKKKKILLKLMEEGKLISQEMQKKPLKYKRIKKLSNY